MTPFSGIDRNDPVARSFWAWVLEVGWPDSLLGGWGLIAHHERHGSLVPEVFMSLEHVWAGWRKTWGITVGLHGIEAPENIWARDDRIAAHLERLRAAFRPWLESATTPHEQCVWTGDDYLYARLVNAQDVTSPNPHLTKRFPEVRLISGEAPGEECHALDGWLRGPRARRPVRARDRWHRPVEVRVNAVAEALKLPPSSPEERRLRACSLAALIQSPLGFEAYSTPAWSRLLAPTRPWRPPLPRRENPAEVDAKLQAQALPLTPSITEWPTLDQLRGWHRQLYASVYENAREIRLPWNQTIGAGMPMIDPKYIRRDYASIRKRLETLNPTICSLAWYHVRLQQCHPFADGNGHTGRFVLAGQLKALGAPVPDDFIHSAKEPYRAAITGALREGSTDVLSAWLSQLAPHLASGESLSPLRSLFLPRLAP